MKVFIAKHFVPAMLVVLFLFVILPAFDSVTRIVKTFQPAISWQGVRVLTPKVEPGGILYLVYTATINEQCPADIRGFLIASDGTVPVRFPAVTGGYAKPDDEPVEIRVSIQIPAKSDSGLAPLMTGDYVYRSIATRYCPDGVEDDNAIPDARFVLEVPPEK